MRKGDTKELQLYKEALGVACELLNGGVIYGIDADRIFHKIMVTEDGCCSLDYANFIIKNIDRFSDDDKKRAEAIKRLGW